MLGLACRIGAALTPQQCRGQGGPIPKSFFATEGFWKNDKPTGYPERAGLQEHYIKAVAEVVKRFKGSDTVLGYEIKNEPMPGSQIDPYAFSKNTLCKPTSSSLQATSLATRLEDGVTLSDCRTIVESRPCHPL